MNESKIPASHTPIDKGAMMLTMETLEPPDSHFLSAAEGWIGLGNLAEARTELALISEKHQNDLPVLNLRWELAAHEADWQSGLEIARTILDVSPEECDGWLHQAYALRRVPIGGLQAAWEALLPALERFPDVPTIPYNLACYACQLQQMDQARLLLNRAIQIGGKDQIKKMALHDTDLQALWSEIRAY